MARSSVVVGLGHTGLPLAVWWAERPGPPVVGLDRDERVIARLDDGSPGPEPELAERLSAARASGRLTLTTRPPTTASVIALCLPTPLTEARTADLSALDDAVATMLPLADPGALWIVSSTVPVGTTEGLARRVRVHHPGARIAMCPERVLPGRIMHEIVHVPRVVGGVDAASTEAARVWFADRSEAPVIPTSAALAELTKLVENASRDAELAVTHAAAELARDHGLDPFALQELVNAHPRARMWAPGVGIGGHCLPVDPWFLVRSGSAAGALFAAVRSFAGGIPARWADDLRARRAPPARVGILGIAYKADSADVRNAPALALARDLARDYDVVVTDPHAAVPDDLVGVDLPTALEADVVVFAVDHSTWAALRPPERAGQLIIDACGGWRRRGYTNSG
ncbi:MAG: nucleotide sugar dehydrogenase [Myxococcota bacterium]